MRWHLWSFLSALPLGALAAFAWFEQPTPPVIAASAAAGATLLALATALLARRAAVFDAPRRLAGAVSLGWAALPALAAILLPLEPGPQVSLAVIVFVVVFALARAARSTARARPLLRGVVAVAFAALVLGVWNTLAAELDAGVTPVPEARADALFDLDAKVATRLLPACKPRPRRVETLLARGAHPRFGAEARRLWFDADDAHGRRQIHRLELASGEVSCWTCGESGNNVRPAPGAGDRLVAFETDRHATWRHPANAEIHVVAGAAELPGRRSRRLTIEPGIDSRPVFGPEAAMLVWSHAGRGRHAVVGGSIRSGHGGIILGGTSVLFSAGAAWAAPLAWSPDARSLVVAHGNPLAPLELVLLDPATGARRGLGADAGYGADFNADGGWLARTGDVEAGSAAWLPARLGFLLGPWATWRSRRAPLLGPGGVRAGPVEVGAQASPALQEIEGWGEITGIALAPDATTLVLGQRRREAGGVRERLVRVDLDCATESTEDAA